MYIHSASHYTQFFACELYSCSNDCDIFERYRRWSCTIDCSMFNCIALYDDHYRRHTVFIVFLSLALSLSPSFSSLYWIEHARSYISWWSIVYDGKRWGQESRKRKRKQLISTFVTSIFLLTVTFNRLNIRLQNTRLMSIFKLGYTLYLPIHNK